ncbi:MAG: hypothetical protein U1G08_00590 [Verrucomicrobiota bacterium]
MAVSSVALAQSDNFDSGTLGAGWKKYEFFPQSYTFPLSNPGQALRIQAAPVPGAAPAAAAILRDPADFYVAIDPKNWQVSDQVVLLAHWNPGGDDGLRGGTESS